MNSIDINNARLLDNPFFGLGSENYIQADGMGESEYFLLRRDIYLDGIKVYKVGQLISGIYLGDNLVKVTLNSKLQNILGKKNVKLHIPKDIVKAEFFKADGGNNTEMGMADMLCDEVSSNATGSTINPAIIEEENPTTVTPVTPKTGLTTAPTTTAINPIATATPTATPISATTPVRPTTLQVRPRPTMLGGIRPVQEFTPITPRTPITPVTTVAPVTPLVPTTPTTIITPAILTSIPTNAIMPYPQEVIPAVTSMPSGGGGGGMMGGGGGDSAPSEERTAEQKPVDATAKPAVVERKILGVKPMYVYTVGGGLILLAAGFYAYKKGWFNGILNK